MTDTTDEDDGPGPDDEAPQDEPGAPEDSDADEDGAVEEAREAPAGQEGQASGGKAEPSPPQQLLDALGDEIDEVRRRTVDDDASQGSDEGDERFTQRGEADEDQPVDDTIAPPG